MLIYKEVLVPPNYWSPRYFVVRGPDSTKQLSVTRSGKHIRQDEKVGYKHNTPPLAIAFTCRAIYLEASPIWYAAWTFKFLENGQMKPFVDAVGYSSCFGTRSCNVIKHALLQLDSVDEDLHDLRVEMFTTTIRLECLLTLDIRVAEYAGTERWEMYRQWLKAICKLSPMLQSGKLLGEIFSFKYGDDRVFESLRRLTGNTWRGISQMIRVKTKHGSTVWKSCNGFYDIARSRIVSQRRGREFIKLMLELS